MRKTDPNGFVQMPGSRTASSPDIHWYFANDPSPACPTGFGDEEAIRAVWAAASISDGACAARDAFPENHVILWHRGTQASLIPRDQEISGAQQTLVCTKTQASYQRRDSSNSAEIWSRSGGRGIME